MQLKGQRMKRHIVAAVVLFVLLALTPCRASAWNGTVVSVHDGDTITVARQDGTRERIRLFGVDCPELKFPGRWDTQPYARAAKRFVQGILPRGAAVAIQERGESYGRIVAGVISLDDGRTVQAELVRAGYAWIDGRYCKRDMPECTAWRALQHEAVAARRGLWKARAGSRPPIAPLAWRSGQDVPQDVRGDE